MKKLFTIFILFLASLNLSAQIVFSDNFEYGSSAGSIISLSGGKWVENTTASTTNIQQYDPSSSITFPNLASKGGKLNFLNTGQDITAAFSSSVNSGSLYAGVLVNFSAAQATGDYFFHFMQSTTVNTYLGRVFVKLNGSNINFGLMKNSGGSVPYATNPYSLNTTYCIVLKYTFNTASTTDDVATLFVFDAATGLPLTEPSNSEISQTINTDATSIGAIAVRQGATTAGASGSVDNIVVSTAWADMQALMPLQLKSFTCVPKKNAFELKWQTANELNFDYFSLEKSNNGKDFVQLANIKGSGGSNINANYSYLDIAFSSPSYYRLKMVDKDGSFKYSQVLFIKDNESSFNLSIYPNPVTDYATVTHPIIANKESLTLVDVYGKVIKNILPLAGTSQTTFNTSSLIKGTYFINFISAEKKYSTTLVK